MIVLDANVVSEAMKPAADPAVRSWLNEQVAETLYLAGVTGRTAVRYRCAAGRSAQEGSGRNA